MTRKRLIYSPAVLAFILMFVAVLALPAGAKAGASKNTPAKNNVQKNIPPKNNVQKVVPPKNNGQKVVPPKVVPPKVVPKDNGKKDNDNNNNNNKFKDTDYLVTNLVSDGFVPANHIDPDLVNPWGIAHDPYGFFRVADNGMGVATTYDGEGTSQSQPIIIPPPMGGTDTTTTTATSTPTGAVFNGSLDPLDFPIAPNVPAMFLFATEDGTIAGWSPELGSNTAVLVVDNSTSSSVYKGIAIDGNGTSLTLFATDFHNNRVDVFDRSFKKVQLAPGAFTDKTSPKIPADFAPFGIQNINGNLYVTFAEQNAAKHDNLNGPGLGFVDVFDPQGVFIRRVASRGKLNAPWGVALAPDNFGQFSNSLIIGNFGDGAFNAFALSDGRFLGQLRDTKDKVIKFPGLWGITFGNGVDKQPINALFFAAGLDDEMHGLYGRIDVPTPPVKCR